MPKITRIEKQKNRSDRVSIYLDEKYAFSLSLNQLLDLKLRVGLEVAASDLEKFLEKSQESKVKDSLLNKLARRPHSRFELEQWARLKKFPQEATKEFLDAFEERGYLDDEKFARQWIEERSTNKKRSKRQLQQELRGKGVSADIVDLVLSEQSDEIEVLRALVEKKRKLPRYKDDKKLTEYLLRQGFRYDDIKTVLNL